MSIFDCVFSGQVFTSLASIFNSPLLDGKALTAIFTRRRKRINWLSALT
ncbi:hypothetical protein KCP76_24310 [Salmonella enterica subsp. enterica serovar Weltevreden]|nr:hypothetical protein KCP76_24310 [Salmonella enterica subsp. enterica serovar Weltevreden]